MGAELDDIARAFEPVEHWFSSDDCAPDPPLAELIGSAVRMLREEHQALLELRMAWNERMQQPDAPELDARALRTLIDEYHACWRESTGGAGR